MRSIDAEAIRRELLQFDMSQFAGRFITDELIDEVRRTLLSIVGGEPMCGVPAAVIERDLMISMERTPAHMQQKHPAIGDNSLRITFKTDEKCQRVKVSLPSNKGAVLVLLILDLDLDRLSKGQLNDVYKQKDAVNAALCEWMAATDDGAEFRQRHPKPNMRHLSEHPYCALIGLVPPTALPFLRSRGIMEMWVTTGMIQWEAEDAILPKAQVSSN